MTANELRSKYIEFFKSKNHVEISGQSLIPENDPSVLFTMAGMHPLVPYLLGEKHPAGTCLTDYQKCIRTGDIEEVGDPSHLTCFEMLGNWSLGDYFKKESIEIYKNSKYQFPYNSTYIHNLFYKNKETSNMFSEQIIYKYKLIKTKFLF